MTDEGRARARMWAAIVAAVNSQVMGGVDEAVDAFEAAIRADEREKCAQEFDAWRNLYGRAAAAVIGAMGDN